MRVRSLLSIRAEAVAFAAARGLGVLSGALTLLFGGIASAWAETAARPEPVSLFDGRTWAGWDHPSHLDGAWEIADGVIRLRGDQPKRERGKNYDLSTTRRFRNFILTVDWRLTGTPKKKPLQPLAD